MATNRRLIVNKSKDLASSESDPLAPGKEVGYAAPYAGAIALPPVEPGPLCLQCPAPALAGTCGQVNAYTGISFLGAELFGRLFALSGGNAGIVRHFLPWCPGPSMPRR